MSDLYIMVETCPKILKKMREDDARNNPYCLGIFNSIIEARMEIIRRKYKTKQPTKKQKQSNTS